MEKRLEALRELRDGIEEDWTANDGGLTMAACDVTATINNLIALVLDGDQKEIEAIFEDSWNRNDLLSIEVEAIEIAHFGIETVKIRNI